MTFSQALAHDSPFKAREFFAGKDAATLTRDILVLDQDGVSAALRKSPMKRPKLAALERNAAVALKAVETTDNALVRTVSLHRDTVQAGQLVDSRELVGCM